MLNKYIIADELRLASYQRCIIVKICTDMNGRTSNFSETIRRKNMKILHLRDHYLLYLSYNIQDSRSYRFRKGYCLWLTWRIICVNTYSTNCTYVVNSMNQSDGFWLNRFLVKYTLIYSNLYKWIGENKNVFYISSTLIENRNGNEKYD